MLGYLKNNKAFVSLIVLELIAIVALTGYQLTGNNLNSSLTFIDKNYAEFSSSSLNYFYDAYDTGKWKPSYRPDWAAPPGITMKNGFNERFVYSSDKPSDDVFRIVALGDSWTFGVFVDTPLNWVEQLEKKMNKECKNKIQVINLGMAGYDLVYSAERFLRRGFQYNPDLVLWFIRKEDFKTNMDFLKGKSKEFLRELSLEEGRDENMEVEEWKNQVQKSVLGEVINSSFSKARELMEKKFTQEDIENYQIHKGIYRVRKSYDGSLFLFSADDHLAHIDGELETKLNEYTQEREKTYYKNIKFGFNSQHLLPDGHPSEKGHKKISQELSNLLKENKIISCK